jgi:hypothetical protein
VLTGGLVIGIEGPIRQWRLAPVSVSSTLESRAWPQSNEAHLRASCSASPARRVQSPRSCAGSTSAAAVQVVMTEGARRFVTPLTFKLSGRRVRGDLWDPAAEAARYVSEAQRWTDVVVVAPATADFLARLARALPAIPAPRFASRPRAPIVVAPAQLTRWPHPATCQRASADSRGVRFLGPAEASGLRRNGSGPHGRADGIGGVARAPGSAAVVSRRRDHDGPRGRASVRSLHHEPQLREDGLRRRDCRARCEARTWCS